MPHELSPATWLPRAPITLKDTEWVHSTALVLDRCLAMPRCAGEWGARLSEDEQWAEVLKLPIMSHTFFISTSLAVEKRGIKNGSSGLTALAGQHTLRQKRFIPKDFPSPTWDYSCVYAYTHRKLQALFLQPGLHTWNWHWGKNEEEEINENETKGKKDKWAGKGPEGTEKEEVAAADVQTPASPPPGVGLGGGGVQEKWQLPQGSLPPPHTLTSQKHFLPIPRIRDRFPNGSLMSPTIIPCGLHNWPIRCLHIFFHESEGEKTWWCRGGGVVCLGRPRSSEGGRKGWDSFPGFARAPRNNCKLRSMQTWVMVSSVLLRPSLQLRPPGLCPYLRSGN